MAVPFVDLGRTPEGLDAAVRAAVLRVLGHRRFILGPEVASFEAAVAPLVGGREAVGVSSGTDALLVALTAVGVGPGDAVATTPFSFFATAGVVTRLGARPVFVDVDPATLELDPRALAALERGGVRAVVPVHLFGHVMDLDPVLDWAGDVPVVEDAAQAIGARDRKGRLAGTLSALACFSFFPTKNLGAIGDAGLVAGDAELAARVRRLRTHGQTETYRHDEVGGNFRLDALQAAALEAALPWLDGLQEARRRNALGYDERLRAAGLADGRVMLPPLEDGRTWHQYVVRIPGARDAVLAGLRKKGIGAAVYYPVPLHLQPPLRGLGYREGDLPEAERAAREVLALPVFPGLREEEQEEVVSALGELLGGGSPAGRRT